MFYFLIIAYRILKRGKQRLNIIFSGFFISVSIGLIINMVYAVIENTAVVLVLNVLTNYFIFFGIVFLFIVNMIILESTLVFSVKRQNRYIVLYGIVLLVGMLTLVLIGIIETSCTGETLIGVEVKDGAPKWGIIFFTYVVFIITGFTIIPIIYTNLKIYFRFETKSLKRKWFCYLIGSFGMIIIFYFMCVNGLVADEGFRLIVGILGISVIIWVSLMYYGLGTRLKK